MPLGARRERARLKRLQAIGFTPDKDGRLHAARCRITVTARRLSLTLKITTPFGAIVCAIPKDTGIGISDGGLVRPSGVWLEPIGDDYVISARRVCCGVPKASLAFWEAP